MADDPVDRLYGLALDSFVAERDRTAKELRAAGRRDEAAAVKALAKPTVAAWAVNQAVRSQPRAAGELWKAGDALAAAQDAVLSAKGSGADLRAATERERAALDPLVDAARGLLSSSGGDLSETTIERVRDTLHSAAIDPEARDDVAAGRATRERAPQGLFGGAAVAAPPRPARRRRGEPAAEPAARRAPSVARAPRREAAAAARERQEAAERRREEAAARKREREEAAARDRARRAAADRVARAERALAAAEDRSTKAAERLEQARSQEREAADALAAARADLEALGG